MASSVTWQRRADFNLRHYLSFNIGRANYEVIRDSMDPDLRDVAERLIQEGVRSCEDRYLLKLNHPVGGSLTSNIQDEVTSETSK